MKLFVVTFSALMVLLTSLSSLANGDVVESKKVLVFSDVDDTIKISNVRDPLEMVSFSVFRDSLFFGMNVVYQGIEKTNGATFYYVSNGWKPTVEQAHQAILNDFDFPNRENYYARNLKKLITKFPHKIATIMQIALMENPGTIVLIGDNGESDPKTYRDIKIGLEQYFKSQGKAINIHIYIHTVYQPTNVETLDLYPGQKPFVNAADLAIKLAQDNLLDRNIARGIVAKVDAKIKAEGKNRVYGPLVNPYFKYNDRSGRSVMCRSFYAL